MSQEPLRLFIVNTYHLDYDESNPYIVWAANENEARALVEQHPDFVRDRDLRKRKKGELPWNTGFHAWQNADKIKYGVERVEAAGLDKSFVVWAVKNEG